jgi:hypothetical protein
MAPPGVPTEVPAGQGQLLATSSTARRHGQHRRACSTSRSSVTSHVPQCRDGLTAPGLPSSACRKACAIFDPGGTSQTTARRRARWVSIATVTAATMNSPATTKAPMMSLMTRMPAGAPMFDHGEAHKASSMRELPSWPLTSRKPQEATLEKVSN